MITAVSPLDKYKHIINRVSVACSNVGRSISEIMLIGVSKGQNIEKIKPFIDLGLKNIGESYFQEAITKIPKIREYKQTISIHFIGHLQTNKVKKILPHTDLIQSVDSLKVANEINKRVEQLNLNPTTSNNRIKDPLPVLLQVN